jgi:hypothetical protein
MEKLHKEKNSKLMRDYTQAVLPVCAENLFK